MKTSRNKFLDIIQQSLSDQEYDYTTGSLRKAIVLLAIPMMLEMCLESVFAVVDIYFVNKLGSHAVSIVGLTEAVLTIVYSVAIGLSSAATALVARRVGEKNPEGATAAAKQALIVSIVLILIMSVSGYVYAENILRMMGAEEAAIQSGIGFTRIMMGGSIVIVLLFLINGIFRGAGNASIAMKSLWLANGCNIILCPILINGIGPMTGFGIEGAAMATTIGRGIGVLYQLRALFSGQNSMLKMSLGRWIPDFEVIKSLGSIAGPATAQFIIQSASWMFLAAIIARSGSEASAGYQTAIRLIMFFILPAWGISNAAATLVGQNLGAGHPERAAQSVLSIAKYNAILMFFVTVFLFFFSPPLISIFIANKSGAQWHYAVQALQVISLGYVLYGVGMVLMQAFNGAGDTKTPTMISVVGFWLIQVPGAYYMAIIMGLGPLGVFISVPAAETVIAGIYWYYFRKGKWMEVKV
ncbi:MAG: MATE family efflux transporter [Flavobacteriales bacterium]|nr:MATE family efflux transporter [Flavobacteriales bacterium]